MMKEEWLKKQKQILMRPQNIDDLAAAHGNKVMIMLMTDRGSEAMSGI